MNVYLAPVGLRDPYWNSENGKNVSFNQLCETNYNPEDVKIGPVLDFFNNLTDDMPAPEKIYLLATKEGPGVGKGTATIKGANMLMEILKERRYKSFLYEADERLNPSDYVDAMNIVRMFVDYIQAHEEGEFFTNASPGTPQINTSLIILKNYEILKGKIYQNIQGKGPFEVKVKSIFEEEIKTIAHDLFMSYSFKSSARLLRELSDRTSNEQRKESAIIFSNVCDAYALRDLFQNREAHNKLSSPEMINNIYGELKEILDIQRNILRELSNDVDIKLKIKNFYSLAEMKRRSGNYADSLWRCTTIIEDIYVIRANKLIKGIDLQSDDRIEDWLKEKIQRELRNGNLRKPTAEKIINRLDNEISGDKIYKIRKIFNLRNNVIHDGASVNDSQIQSALDITKNLIILQFGADISNEINDYAFTSEKINEVGELIKKYI